VIRFSEANDRPCRVKPMKLDTAGAKTVERMFLVEPPEDAIAKLLVPSGDGMKPMTQGQWATESVAQFAEHLKVYLGWSPRSPGASNDGEGGDE
jgi:hypothetical protein